MQVAIIGFLRSRMKVVIGLRNSSKLECSKHASIKYVYNFMYNLTKLWRDGRLETRQAL